MKQFREGIVKDIESITGFGFSRSLDPSVSAMSIQHSDPLGIRAIEAGPLDPFNHSFSIIIECETQAEIDRLWDALKEGGSTEQCGWLRDRWGLSWRITPKRLGERMRDPDQVKAKRVAEAMLKMMTFDIAGLETAAKGRVRSRSVCGTVFKMCK